jgi:replicative DNA helicase
MTDLIPIEAEMGVIGGMTIDNEVVHKVALHVDPEDFGLTKHQEIVCAIFNLSRRGDPVDFLTITAELDTLGNDDNYAAYISKCINSVPSALNAESYAQTVAQKAEERRMERAAGEIAKLAHAPLPIEDKREKSRQILQQVHSRKGTGAVTARQAMEDISARVAEWAESPLGPGEVRGYSTGLRDLDTLMDGLGIGLYLIAAAQHVGKSAFCHQLSVNIADQGGRILVFTMEDSREQVAMRWACNLAKVDMKQVRRGLQGDDYARFVRAQGRIAEWNAEIVEGHVPLPQLHAEIVGRANTGPLDLVVVDNLEIASKNARGNKEYVRLRSGAYGLLGAANAGKLPLLTTMQIGVKKLENRPNKEPEMGDIYGSDGPGHAASAVWLLHRDDRWTFDESKKNHIMKLACWKDKVYHSGTGKGREFVFGPQGQVWDKARE